MTTTETILTSTAFMNQPATRAFRVELVWKCYGCGVRDEYIVWYRSPDGSRWVGSYYETLFEACTEFTKRAWRSLSLTAICADRLETEFQPFVPSAKLGEAVTNDQFRW